MKTSILNCNFISWVCLLPLTMPRGLAVHQPSVYWAGSHELRLPILAHWDPVIDTSSVISFRRFGIVQTISTQTWVVFHDGRPIHLLLVCEVWLLDPPSLPFVSRNPWASGYMSEWEYLSHTRWTPIKTLRRDKPAGVIAKTLPYVPWMRVGHTCVGARISLNWS